MTIVALFGTRPEAIKLWPVIEALRRRDARIRLIATAQHRALLDDVLAVTGLVPDLDLDLMRPGATLPDLAARLIGGVGDALVDGAASRILVQGDTLTALAGALAGMLLRIPVAHVEAGLRSGDPTQPWPEEHNRKLIAAVADLHFAPTATAVAALRREGVDPATIHLTGNSGIDALLRIRDRARDLPPTLADALARFAGRRIVAVTAHRRESFGAGLDAVGAAVATIAARPDVGVILPLHPNPEVAAALLPHLGDHPDVAILPPLDHPAFVALMDRAALILSDSGGVQEEAPALGRPLLVLRETTERPEAIACGAALLVGTDRDRIVAEATRLLDDPARHARMAVPRFPFGDGAAGARIAAILAPQIVRSPRPTPT